MIRSIFFILNLVFVSAFVFAQYSEPYQENNKWGYKDGKGNIIVTPKYDGAEKFSWGFAIVEMNKKFGFINAKGEEIVAPVYDKVENFRYGYAKIQSDKKWGLVDGKGKIILSTKYDGITQIYKEKYVSVELNGKWGLIDFKENVIIPIEYDYTLFGNDGVFAVSKNDKAGFINLKNEIVIPFDYSNTEDFYDGFAEVAIGDSVGAINRSGQVIIPIQFKRFNYIDDYHRIFVENPDRTFGIWLDNGQKITEMIYHDYVELDYGYLVLISHNGQCLLSPFNTMVLPCEFQYINESEFSSDYLIFKKNDKFGLYNTLKHEVAVDAIYDGYQEFEWDENYVLISNENKYGVYNLRTKTVVIQPMYDQIETENYAYYLVRNDNLYGLLNYRGDVLLEPKYLEIFVVDKKTVGGVTSDSDAEPLYFTIKGGTATPKQ